MAEKEVRKTVKKKAVRKTTAKVASPRSAASEKALPSNRVRKAPARALIAEGKKNGDPKFVLIAVCMFVILLGLSAAIGYSDKGQLNVERTITLRKANASPEEKTALDSVSTQKQSNTPNGGLVPDGGLVANSNTQISPSTAATTTASTTATAIATSSASTTATSDTASSTASSSPSS